MAVTTQDQLANVYGGVDLPCKNYGVSDIAANKVVAIDGTNAVGDSSTVPGNVIPGIVLPSTGGNPTLSIGITQEIVKAGTVGRVRVLGLAWATAQGAISPGTIVDASATTAGMVAAHTSGKFSFAQAVTKAADGDPILVLINSGNAANA